MSYRIGDEVLLTKLMGEEFETPVRVKITDHVGQERGRIFEYEVMLPRVRGLETGREVRNLRCWVKNDWLAPANFVIQETPDYSI